MIEEKLLEERAVEFPGLEISDSDKIERGVGGLEGEARFCCSKKVLIKLLPVELKLSTDGNDTIVGKEYFFVAGRLTGKRWRFTL